MQEIIHGLTRFRPEFIRKQDPAEKS